MIVIAKKMKFTVCNLQYYLTILILMVIVAYAMIETLFAVEGVTLEFKFICSHPSHSKGNVYLY